MCIICQSTSASHFVVVVVVDFNESLWEVCEKTKTTETAKACVYAVKHTISATVANATSTWAQSKIFVCKISNVIIVWSQLEPFLYFANVPRKVKYRWTYRNCTKCYTSEFLPVAIGCSNACQIGPLMRDECAIVRANYVLLPKLFRTTECLCVIVHLQGRRQHHQ